MAENATDFEQHNLPLQMLMLGLFLDELFFVAVFTVYGVPIATVYYVFFTLILTFGGLYILAGGAELDLRRHEWIKGLWSEWFNLFTTTHYSSWLYHKDMKAWFKLFFLYWYSFLAEFVFLLIASNFHWGLIDSATALLVIGSILFSVGLPAAIWFLWNLYREFT